MHWNPAYGGNVSKMLLSYELLSVCVCACARGCAWVNDCRTAMYLVPGNLSVVVPFIDIKVEKEKHKLKTWFYCGKAMLPLLLIHESQ